MLLDLKRAHRYCWPCLLIVAVVAPNLHAAGKPFRVQSTVISIQEDGPAIPEAYRFRSGDTVYLSFLLNGYQSKAGAEYGSARQVEMEYSIDVVDGANVPVVAPTADKITAELEPEDKEWTPKRRTSLVVPANVAAGDFTIRIKATDRIGNTEAAEERVVHIAGPQLKSDGQLKIENLAFFRSQDDAKPIEIAAYQAGDDVVIRFDVIGFQLEKGNLYNVEFDLVVLRPGGKTQLTELKNAAQSEASFYPPQYVPGGIRVTTPSKTPAGQYQAVLTVHDLVSKQNAEVKTSFQIE